MSEDSVRQLSILVFNVGSSSLSFKLYCDSSVFVRGKCYRVGVAGKEPSRVEISGPADIVETIELPDHHAAAVRVLDYLATHQVRIDAAGHRFADGGGYFSGSALVTPETRLLLEQCAPLAPLHNMAALGIVDLVDNRLPGRPQYVVFDSSFHVCMPDVARTYALPASLSDRFRKHGFHGLSYADVLSETQWYLGEKKFKAVVLHLGTGGSSACAIMDGRSIDTSMGFSPLAGLV
ncbi:MAG: acetate kinase, partial [Chloroflexota bacterium]